MILLDCFQCFRGYRSTPQLGREKNTSQDLKLIHLLHTFNYEHIFFLLILQEKRKYQLFLILHYMFYTNTSKTPIEEIIIQYYSACSHLIIIS